MFSIALISIWSICLILIWCYTRLINTFNADYLQDNEQCHQNAKTQAIIEPIVIMVIITSNTLLLLLRTMNKCRHTRYTNSSSSISPNALMQAEAQSQVTRNHCTNTTSKILCIISVLFLIFDLFYIEWYFKIIECNTYPHQLKCSSPSAASGFKSEDSNTVGDINTYISCHNTADISFYAETVTYIVTAGSTMSRQIKV